MITTKRVLSLIAVFCLVMGGVYFFGIGQAKISVGDGADAGLVSLSVKANYFLKLLGVTMWGLAYVAWSTRNVKRGSDTESRLVYAFTVFSLAMVGMSVYSLVNPPFIGGGEDVAGYDNINLFNYPLLTILLVLALVGIRRNAPRQSRRR
ncbi:MAG: hypothetical protein VX699_00205 [Myxococcota bacterium]|nr:hypothetical protein [Myxococcota bacterium]